MQWQIQMGDDRRQFGVPFSGQVRLHFGTSPRHSCCSGAGVLHEADSNLLICRQYWATHKLRYRACTLH
jgi:hypothetical protein